MSMDRLRSCSAGSVHRYHRKLRIDKLSIQLCTARQGSMNSHPVGTASEYFPTAQVATVRTRFLSPKPAIVHQRSTIEQTFLASPARLNLSQKHLVKHTPVLISRPFGGVACHWKNHAYQCADSVMSGEIVDGRGPSIG